MRRLRPETHAVVLQRQIFYAVAELAREGNVPPYRLLRLLRRNGVTFLRAGRAYYVGLDEIRGKIPSLWRSLQLAEDLRRGADARKREGTASSRRPTRLYFGESFIKAESVAQ